MRTGVWLRRAVSALAATVVLNTGLVPAASASPTPTPSAVKPPTVTFGIGAADAKGVDRRPFLNYTVDPGSTINDHVVLVNLGRKRLTVNLYTADALNGTGGQIGYAPRATPGDGAHRWIAVDPASPRTSITLAPRSRRVLPIRIAVPTTASPGDHLAAVIASVNSVAKGGGPTGQDLRFEQRVALRAFFRVSGTVRAQLAVDGITAAYRGTLNPAGRGSVSVDYTLRNAGNVNLAGRQAVVVTGIFGSTGTATVTAQLPVLLPGSSVVQHVVFRHVLPEIFMHARVTVRPEGLSGAVDPTLAPSSATASFWAVPWTLIAGVVALLALAAAGLWWRRRHPVAAPAHRPPPGRTRTPVGVA